MDLTMLDFGTSILDQAQGSIFDPVEANFLSTILRDCYDQLHNVGDSAEVKRIKFPELIKTERRLKESVQAPTGKQTSRYQLSDIVKTTNSEVSLRVTNVFSSIYQGREVPKMVTYSGLDDNATWMERLVEAHGYLEDSYIKIVEKAKSVLESKKDSQEKVTVNLEQQGIRLKIFELSRAIADRENALSLMNKSRIKSILDGLRNVVLKTSEELKKQGTYETLKQRNKIESMAIGKGPNLINQELQLHDLCRLLIESIIEEKKRGQLMIKEREAQIASLKDYLKEQKVLRSIEIAYIKKFSEASLDQAKLANDKKMEELQSNEELILKQIKDDVRTNDVMESFLKKEIAAREELLKWWNQKYDIEVERKMTELKEVKDQLEKDEEWLDMLKKRIVEYEQVIEDDKRQKLIDRNRRELEKLQEKKAIQIQKWWRGLRVRRCLGPFKKKKKRAKGGGKKKGKKK